MGALLFGTYKPMLYIIADSISIKYRTISFVRYITMTVQGKKYYNVDTDVCISGMHVHHGDLVSHTKAEKEKGNMSLLFF